MPVSEAREGPPFREGMGSLIWIDFLLGKSSFFGKGWQNDKITDHKIGKLFSEGPRMEYPLILKNMHPWLKVKYGFRML